MTARKALDNLRGLGADEKVGIDIVRRAVSAPLKQIADNAGHDGSVVAANVENKNEPNYGFNALTHKYGDLVSQSGYYPRCVAGANSRHNPANRSPAEFRLPFLPGNSAPVHW